MMNVFCNILCFDAFIFMQLTLPLDTQPGFSYLEAFSPIQKPPLSYQKWIQVFVFFHDQNQKMAGV